MTRAVVFGYHQVGVRCLEVLLGQGVEVPLIFSHEDDPKEVQWFPSLRERAENYGIRVVTPASPNTSEWIETVRHYQPDFIFSFYYRHLICSEYLQMAPLGAFNMHGSLLPKYRGRVPVNWAIIHGEKETGATLHVMAAKADQGDCVDQMAVPILPNDTGFEVFQKVCVAAECVLNRTLPLLIAGKEQRFPQDASMASYYGRRTPEDGRIIWSHPATAIHNLIRAVAPPYPGAFFEESGQQWVIKQSMLLEEKHVPDDVKSSLDRKPGTECINGVWWARGGDGNYLRLFGVVKRNSSV